MIHQRSMSNGHPKTSWESFKTVGDEMEKKHPRKDTILGWICLVMLLALVTITVVPLLLAICIVVATGGRLLSTTPNAYVNTDKLSIFGDRASIQLFVFALGVWWVTKQLAEPIRAVYGSHPAAFARFGMACVAYAPAVWFMKRQIDRHEAEAAARRQVIEEAKKRKPHPLLDRRDEE